MSYRPTLKTVQVNGAEFNLLLEKWAPLIRRVDNIEKYMNGYRTKTVYAYNGEDILITLDSALKTINPKLKTTSVKQVVIKLNNKPNAKPAEIRDDISGTYAWNYIWYRKILKMYTEEEAVAVLRSYDDTEYKDDLRQFHLMGFGDGYHVYTNCYKYDINGAHADALCEIFSKSADLIRGVRTRKLGKMYINYFVGMLKRKGYAGAYDYIVQRTTAKLFRGIDEVGGRLLYANTDGFLVTNPTGYITPSKELGEFKLEFKGTVYSYVDINYFVFELDNAEHSKTGSCLDSVRHLIDLKNKKVIHYKRSYNDNGQAMVDNLIEEQL